jgi:hypothetical protein
MQAPSARPYDRNYPPTDTPGKRASKLLLVSVKHCSARVGQVKSAYSWFRFRPLRSTVVLRKYSTGTTA